MLVVESGGHRGIVAAVGALCVGAVRCVVLFSVKEQLWIMLIVDM